jgi:hypothetical protein
MNQAQMTHPKETGTIQFRIRSMTMPTILRRAMLNRVHKGAERGPFSICGMVRW